MLPAPHRLSSRRDHVATLQHGRPARSGALVAHYWPRANTPTPAKVGFAVSRRIGNAVTRNQVTRRLRHLMRARLGRLPAGATLVIRALPPAATLDFATLERDLEGCLRRAQERST